MISRSYLIGFGITVSIVNYNNKKVHNVEGHQNLHDN